MKALSPSSRLPTDPTRRKSRFFTGHKPSPLYLSSQHADDPRWMLAQRIIASNSFGRSSLLSSFLLFVCDRFLDGKLEEITEQQIGVHVFCRMEGYKSEGDNIVRNYARTLRKRMEEYFAKEGREEALIVEIPRGAYVPVFSLRVNEAAAAAEPGQEPASEAQSADRTSTYEPPEQDGPLPGEAADGVIAGENSPRSDAVEQAQSITPLGQAPEAGQRKRLWYAAAAISGALVLGALVGYLAGDRHAAAGSNARWFRYETRSARLNHLFWGSLFDDRRDTFVVPADGGLVMLQSFVRNSVSLTDYVGGNFGTKPQITDGMVELAGELKPENSAKLEHKIEVVGRRRYTSIVDLELTSHLARLREVVPDRLMIRYARDIRIDDLRTGSAILLGSVDANPWVDLFQAQLNFQFLRGGEFGGSGIIINKRPLSGERATYASEQTDPIHRTYGVIAYEPNLEGSGHILIVEGVNSAGTQAAGDFLLRPDSMLPVLERAMAPNGTIRPFEILLETENVASNASRPQVLSERIAPL